MQMEIDRGGGTDMPWQRNPGSWAPPSPAQVAGALNSTMLVPGSCTNERSFFDPIIMFYVTVADFDDV